MKPEDISELQIEAAKRTAAELKTSVYATRALASKLNTLTRKAYNAIMSIATLLDQCETLAEDIESRIKKEN